MMNGLVKVDDYREVLCNFPTFERGFSFLKEGYKEIPFEIPTWHQAGLKDFVILLFPQTLQGS